MRTMLFTDIVGSTSLLQRLGGDRYTNVLQRHQDIVRDGLSAFRGTEVRTEGDAFFATFDTASDGVAAAVFAQRGLGAEAWPSDAVVQVRMGLHVGEVADTTAGLVGLAIHHTARIAAVAHGGQVLVSEQAKVLAGNLQNGISLRELGPHRLRDVGTVDLYQAAHADLRDRFPPIRSVGPARATLPAPRTSLIGRAIEENAVIGLMRHHRIVTLTGAGGSGKTRLALQVAAMQVDRFPDGVWWVDLSALVDASDVAPAVAAVLGVSAGNLDAVAGLFADREALVVLDNCEHVLESCSQFAERLLLTSGASSVLASSRERLGVDGELVFRVPPLSLAPAGATVAEGLRSEAVQLFAARSALVRTGYDVTDSDISAVIEICRYLDGMPLAIELAAAQMRVMTPNELAHRLGDRFALMIKGARGAPPRHQTLRATIEWSLDTLTTEEQSLLLRLAVFRGSADFESVRRVCGAEDGEPEVLALLAGLQDKSLIEADVVGTATRYRLLETIRQCAYEWLAAAEDVQAVHARHAAWFLALAEVLAAGPTRSEDRAWIRRHDTEADNFRAAAEWLLDHDPTAALRLLVAVGEGMAFTPRMQWHAHLLANAVGAAADAPAAPRAIALSLLAIDAAVGAVDADADALEAESIALIETVRDPRARAVVLERVAFGRQFQSPRPLSDADVRPAVEAADDAGDFLSRFMTRLVLGSISPPSLQPMLTGEALRLAEEADNQIFAALARVQLAFDAAMIGASDEALDLCRRSLWIVDDLIGTAYIGVDALPIIEGEHGDLPLALRLAEDLAARLARRPHDPSAASTAHAVVAHLHVLNGDVDSAATAIARTVDVPVGHFIDVLAATARSAVNRMSGHYPAAATTMALALDEVLWHGSTDSPMRLLEELAAVAVAMDRTTDAANLLATAVHERRSRSFPLSPARRAFVRFVGDATIGHSVRQLRREEAIAVAQSLAGGVPPPRQQQPAH